jgi:hypothetical protein
MKKKLTKELMKDLKDEGFTALIAAGQLENDEALFTPSKEQLESIIDVQIAHRLLIGGCCLPTGLNG